MQLAWSDLSIADDAAMTLDQWATFSLDPVAVLQAFTFVAVKQTLFTPGAVADSVSTNLIKATIFTPGEI